MRLQLLMLSVSLENELRPGEHIDIVEDALLHLRTTAPVRRKYSTQLSGVPLVKQGLERGLRLRVQTDIAEQTMVGRACSGGSVVESESERYV